MEIAKLSYHTHADAIFRVQRAIEFHATSAGGTSPSERANAIKRRSPSCPISTIEQESDDIEKEKEFGETTYSSSIRVEIGETHTDCDTRHTTRLRLSD